MQYFTLINTDMKIPANCSESCCRSDHLMLYLDLTFMIESGSKPSTRLNDKRNDFDFHVVNFSFLPSSKPNGPSYGVYISTEHAQSSRNKKKQFLRHVTPTLNYLVD